MRTLGLGWAVGTLLSFTVILGSKSKASSDTFNDAALERVLTQYVNDSGLVNYAALKENRRDLDDTVEQIQHVSPANAPQVFPTREAQLAYWINAYNALVLRMVVDHYPISSITKIGIIPFSAFFVERPQLGGKRMTLRSLENDVIRAGFHDPRIHFAINCASRSCPPLAQHAYRPETLNQQLDAAARKFINDNANVTLDARSGKVELSKIFDWYASDFKEAYAAKVHRDGTVLDYLKLYLTPERQRVLAQLSGATVRYNQYDWSLNDQARRNH